MQEPRWRNEGEARLIAQLLHDAGLVDEPGGPGRLAILTPWHDQRRCLEAALGAGRASRVHTVDSFQGREAEIVVCSLVRDKKSSGGRAYDDLGHLSDPQRVNVMLSRAKRLNVIVGNFEHFRSSDVDFWEVVCNTVRERGRVVVSTGAGIDP
jgi:superfamily I DNA and/or RNA helicase